MPRLLNGSMIFFLLLLPAAWWMKGALPSHKQILPPLLQEPIQGTTDRKEFSFAYAGERYRVKPVASYELWGLVVGHNSVGAIWDIYHTSDSVDTKDLGVIWGSNLRDDQFHQVTMWSGSWTINWSYPAGVNFNHSAIANNHLITDNPATRRKIAAVRIGDQIHFKGVLVNYQAGSTPDFWRNSSLTRSDSGGTACEVVFVDEIEVLKRGTPVWYALFTLCAWGLPLGFACKVAQIVFWPTPAEIDQ